MVVRDQPVAAPHFGDHDERRFQYQHQYSNTDSTINSNFNIQIIWDSSVANAPPGSPGFIYDVEQVANFLASSLYWPTLITIPIDVGYGEINASKIADQRSGKASRRQTREAR